MALKIGEIKRKPGMIWYGSIFGNSYLSRFNRYLTSQLIQNGYYDLGIIPDDEFNKQNIPVILENKICKIPVDIKFYINHQFLVQFNPPDQGHWVLMLPWEYGSMPAAWQETLIYTPDEIWVGSEYTKTCYEKEGIHKERISVIHGGTDTKIFNPNVKGKRIDGAKSFKFLFTGDVLWHTGIDVLLNAFKDEFLDDEDVCLIIKDYASAPLTARQNYINQIKEIQGTQENPQVIYIDTLLSDEELASLYRTCDCFVYPYRAESYSLSVFEAMASGLPVITSNYGSVLDFCNKENSYLISSRLTKHVQKEFMGIKTIDYPYFGQPDVIYLRRLMREVFDDYQTAQNKGIKASQLIKNNFTWNHTLRKVLDRLTVLTDKPLYRIQQSVIHKKIIMGLDAYEKGDLDGSINGLKSAIEADEQNPLIKFDLGMIFLKNHQYDQAIEILEQSIKNYPNNPNAFNLIGMSLFNLDEFALAKMFFEKVIELDPEHGGALDSLNSLSSLIEKQPQINNKLKDEKYRYLLELLERVKAVKKDPTVSLCMITKNEESFLAQCLESVNLVVDEIIIVDTGSTDKTVEIAKDYGAKVYDFPWTNNFSDARNEFFKYVTGDWILVLDADEVLSPESKNNLKEIIKLPVKQLTGYQVKIRNYTQASNEMDMVEHYTMRIFPNSSELRYTGVIHEQVEHIEDKNKLDRLLTNDIIIFHYGYERQLMRERAKSDRNLEMLNQAIDKDKNNAFHYFNLGLTYKVAGKLEESLEAFKTSIRICKEKERFPTYISATYSYTLSVLDELLKFEEAVELGKEAEEFARNNGDYWINIGTAYTGVGEYDKALECYKKASILRTEEFISLVYDKGATTWKPYAGIGNVYLCKKELDKAYYYWKRCLKEYPKNKPLLQSMARLCMDMKNYKMAEKYFLDLIAIQTKEEQDVTRIELANLYICSSQFKEATELLESVKENREMIDVLVQIYFLLGKYDEIFKIYDNLIKQGSENVNDYIGRGGMFLKLKEFDKAEEDFKKALNLDKSSADAWANLGAVYLSKQDPLKAEEFYLKALELNPELVLTYFDLGKIKTYQEDYIKAEEYFEKVMELDPKAIDAMRLLANVEQQLGNLEKACALLVNVLELDPNNIDNLVQLGYVLINLNENQRAIEVFSRALDLDPQNPPLYRGLGMCLLQLGRFEDAHNSFTMAIHLNPDDTEAKKGLELIHKLIGN